ncbi:ergosterol biosynthesis ERG4/ERG24 [Boletus edulis]|nr:ergosterol biosynthesis ERG4/ERG24 [Boletus edulis]
MSSTNELRQRNVDAQQSAAAPATTSDEGRKIDQFLDQHQTRVPYEFGGPWGVTAMMIGFPLLMYYLWICLWFYDGKLVSPASMDDIVPFLHRMWVHVRDDASPNAYAWKVYTGLIVFQLFLAWVVPGYQQEGLPVPSLGYKTLMYNCNALWSIYITMITAALLHYYNIFRLTEIINNYGHIMSVAMIYGFAVSFGVYFLTVATGNQIRMSGNFIYDVFMGACLNPRIGPIDLKMWAEVRIPWVIVFFLAVSGGCHQYEQYGYVTPVSLSLFGDICGKGEECIPQTWDMFHEKWGFMVIFWNFAGVPFLCWDTSMSQKSRFKMQTQGITKFRNTFPQLPWGTLKNPEFIQTAHGNRLLTSGWWRYSRKPNYVADWVMSFCWGVVIGGTTIIPYFYSVFFITVLIHRCGRDFERCSIKYAKDWERYCSIVKYKFIPGVY